MLETLRDWFSGRIPAFQAGDKGSIPLSRTKKATAYSAIALSKTYKTIIVTRVISDLFTYGAFHKVGCRFICIDVDTSTGTM